MIIGDLEIRLRSDIARLQRDMNAARGTVDRATAGISRAANAAKVALAGMGMGIGLAQVVALADQYTKFTAQLKLATTSQREYATAMADVKRIATNAQQELGATGMLYARIANGTRELGIAQSQVSKITEVVNLALKVSGATANESASAQLQLSQAFASGTLRGEEFNAVNEAAPRLMKALAEGMGVPVGALKKMATEGEITSKIMAEVLPKAFEKLNEESKQIQTISGALTVLKNSMMELVGAQAQASGFVTNISGALIYAAENVGKLAGSISTLTAAIVPAMKIAAAYFAIFVAAPIVIATVSTAMTALIGKLAIFIMNVMIGQTQTLYFNRTLFGMSISAELAAGSLNKLMRAGSILFAAFAGWEIGKFITKNDIDVFGLFTIKANEMRIAGLTFVGLMLKGWENLKYGGEMAWEGVKFAFEKSVNVMKSGFGSFLAGVARGLNLIGASDTSKQINAYADSLRAASGAQKTFTEQTAGLTAAHDKAIDVIDTNIVEMIAYELSAKKVTAAETEVAKATTAAVVVAKEKAKAVKAVVDAIEQQLAALRLQVATLGMAEDAATLYKMKMDGATKAQLDQAKSLLLLIGADKLYADQVKSKYDASSASIKAATDEADKNEELARTFGMTKAAIESEELARLEQQLTQAGGIAACTAETAALYALIDAKKRNVAATGSIEALEAEKKFNEDRLTEQKKTVEKYDDIFRIGFADMVNGGKNTWKSFTTSLATTFKTSVADQIYKMFAQPFVIKFVASMMGIVGGAASGVASAATSGGISGGMNMLSAGKTIWDGFAGGMSSSIGGVIASTGSALGLSAVSAFGSGMGMSMASAGAATAAGAVSAGVGITGTAAAATTAGAAIGAAIPYVAVALAIAKVLQLGFGHGERKTTSQGIEGSFGVDGFAGTKFRNWKEEGGWFSSDRKGRQTPELDAGTRKQFSDGFATLKSVSSDFAKSLGLDADNITSFSRKISVALTADDAKNKEAITAMFAGMGEEIARQTLSGRSAVVDSAFYLAQNPDVASNQTFKNAAQGHYDKYGKAEGRAANGSAPTGPDYSYVLKENETYAAALQRLSISLSAVNGTLDTLNVKLYDTSIAGGDMASKLADMFGGLESMQAVSAGYFQSYYSEQEKVDIATRQLGKTFSDLGFVMPVTNAELRKQIEAQDLTTESGRKAYAQLMGLSGAFDSLSKATAQQAAAVAQAAETAAAKASEIASQKRGLEIQIMELSGNAAGALAARRADELAAMDSTLQPLQKVIYGLQDVAKAAQDAAVAANEAARLYFAGLDRTKEIKSMTDSSGAALDKFFGTVTDTSNVNIDAAQAANNAARDAAANWKSIAGSIRSALESVNAQTSQLTGGYASSLAKFQSLTVLARGGDADSAGKLGSAASAFLASAESQSATMADYLRDRYRIENSLTESLGSADSMASAQDLLVKNTLATVNQLQAMNVTLSGFAADVYEMLQKGYKGTDTETAKIAAATLATMTTDFGNYFNTSKEGDKTAYAGGTSFTKLAGDTTQFNAADGSILGYLKSTESILDIAKRFPGIRKAWETQYGIKLPAFAAGGAYQGGMALVGEQGPELINFGQPGQVYNAQQTRGMMGGDGNAELLAELRALKEELKEELRMIRKETVKTSDNTKQSADILDRSTAGGGPTLVRVVTA